MKKTVPERLAELGDIYRERNPIYGNAYLDFGSAIRAMFEGKVTLETPEEFGRFALFNAILGKVARYAQSIKRGGHADSLNDLAVYSMMLREYDDEWSEKL